MNESSTGLHAQTAADRAPDNNGHCRPSGSDALLDRLMREAGAERARLARLSLRITGTETRPAVPREPLVNHLDRLIGGGDLALGRLGRLTLLFREELERDREKEVVVIDFRTSERTVVCASLHEIDCRVRERLQRGDVVPGILFRERPHLAHLAWLVVAVLAQERRKASRSAWRRTRRVQHGR